MSFSKNNLEKTAVGFPNHQSVRLCLVLYFSFSSPVVNPGGCLGSRARADLVSDDKVGPTLSCLGSTAATFPLTPILIFLALSLEHVGTVFEGKEVTSSSPSSSLFYER
jgi:hypothetical protein